MIVEGTISVHIYSETSKSEREKRACSLFPDITIPLEQDNRGIKRTILDKPPHLHQFEINNLQIDIDIDIDVKVVDVKDVDIKVVNVKDLKVEDIEVKDVNVEDVQDVDIRMLMSRMSMQC